MMVITLGLFEYPWRNCAPFHSKTLSEPTIECPGEGGRENYVHLANNGLCQGGMPTHARPHRSKSWRACFNIPPAVPSERLDQVNLQTCLEAGVDAAGVGLIAALLFR